MSDLLQLPHTPGCLVCGPQNPFGLRLSQYVNPQTGIVSVDFAARAEDIGFEGIVHGGMIATVIDEAMVWAATWNIKRFCVCGELSVRFRRAAQVGEPLHLEARVEYARPKLVQTMATLRTPDRQVVAAGEGKYVPMAAENSDAVMRGFIHEPETEAAAALLRKK
ncbi:MAG TPA: hotdog fold domain-containing protein [Tepidisphaeraceae bacterium]|nr:hotdog fold domain-containing protein [Tepidisphaeraceae bacterium]